MELHGDRWNIQEPLYKERSEQAKMPRRLKSTSKRLVYFCACSLRGSKMTAKRCKAVVLSPMVNALIVGGNVSQLTYAGAIDHKRVLTVHLLVILTARNRAFVKHARSARVLALQRGDDRRHHRHDFSRGRSITIPFQFDYLIVLFRKLSISISKLGVEAHRS